METAQDVFKEIHHIHLHANDFPNRYHLLNQTLTRIVQEMSSSFQSDFTHFSSLLRAVCKSVGHQSLPLEVFRANAYKVQQGSLSSILEDYPYDLKALCEGVSAFFHAEIPSELCHILPHNWRPRPSTDIPARTLKRIRLTVHEWDKQFVYGQSHEAPSPHLLKICYAPTPDSPFAPLCQQLYEGAQLNLLSVRTEENAAKGPAHSIVLYPELLVLDPDFLIDITSICACMRPYGHTAYTHILNKFSISPKSAAIQLGNVANLFLDDCVNEKPTDSEMSETALYLRSMQKSFQESPLEYSTLPGIDRHFFTQCQAQFHSIRETVRQRFSAADIDIEKSDVQLEPSFLCEAMGIQGRMDLLMNNLKKLIELKSGKAEEFPQLRPRDEHRIQMALYKEILFYNMNCPRSGIESFLFYSRYPKFYAIDAPTDEIRKAIALRNDIVHLEHRLRRGESPQVIAELNETNLNISGRNDRFYHQYLRPGIMQTIRPLQQMSELEAKYFHTFLTFTEREQFLAKVGDSRPDSSRGFADTWNCDQQTKQQNGNLLSGLQIHPIADEEGAIVQLQAHMPEYEDDFLPNFRPGDMVMLYECNQVTDNATNKQIFRCLIEEIHPEHILLRLAYKQRHSGVFRTDKSYAMEPGYMDSTYHQAYSGLYRLLTAPAERKALLLGQRVPETDLSISLNRNYVNEDITRIVLQAKQASDYFLLVGPPGTGKTSVALKSMVEEFLSDSPQKNLLLMAYTNRAVDEICDMLSTLTPVPEYIRIGQELNCEKAYRPHLMKNVIRGAVNRQQIYEKLAPIHVFTGTISSLCGRMELFELKHIDVAIIDEASQVLEPQLLPLLCATTTANKGDYNLHPCAIRKFILIGDHKQLPAVVSQSPDTSRVTDKQLNDIGLTDCRNSFFERLHALQTIQSNPHTVAMLHKQGRMHPALSEFVNQNFYNGQLDIVPVPHQLEDLEFKEHPTDAWSAYIAHHRMGFLPVHAAQHPENPKSNREEATIVGRIVATIHELCLQNKLKPNLAQRIGIIVPFRGQIAMIRNTLSTLNIPRQSI